MGIVYLEDESYKLQVKKGGREWSVYGSPVRFLLLRAHARNHDQINIWCFILKKWQPYFGGWAFNYRPGEEAEGRYLPYFLCLLKDTDYAT